MAKNTLYVTVDEKIAEQTRIKDALTASFNASTDEVEKASLQEQITVADGKIRWYNGRKNSPKFQAKAVAAAEKAAAQPVEDPASTTEGAVASDPSPAPTEEVEEPISSR